MQITGLNVDAEVVESKADVPKLPGEADLEMAISRLKAGYPKAAKDWAEQAIARICAEHSLYPSMYR